MNVKIIEREVLNPLAEEKTIKREINPIPTVINKISLFDNTKPNADLILETIGKYIEKDSDYINFCSVKKPAGAPATSQQIKKAAKADISILAVGDCGSCTTWVILDAIRLEDEGTPTICICSHQFTSFAYELAKSHGLGELRIVEIEHPIAGQSKPTVEEKTLKILPKIKKLLKIN